MIIWGERNGFHLVPFQRFRPKLEAIPEGVRLRISIDQDRNGKFNALFHVMLELVVSAINSGPAKTDLEPLPSPAIGPNGETVTRPLSTAARPFRRWGRPSSTPSAAMLARWFAPIWRHGLRRRQSGQKSRPSFNRSHDENGN